MKSVNPNCYEKNSSHPARLGFRKGIILWSASLTLLLNAYFCKNSNVNSPILIANYIQMSSLLKNKPRDRSYVVLPTLQGQDGLLGTNTVILLRNSSSHTNQYPGKRPHANVAEVAALKHAKCDTLLFKFTFLKIRAVVFPHTLAELSKHTLQ